MSAEFWWFELELATLRVSVTASERKCESGLRIGEAAMNSPAI